MSDVISGIQRVKAELGKVGLKINPTKCLNQFPVFNFNFNQFPKSIAWKASPKKQNSPPYSGGNRKTFGVGAESAPPPAGNRVKINLT